MRRRDVLAAGLAGLLSPPFGSAWAQQFPIRTIHVIVPSSPGGIHDVIARTWAGRVAADLGTSIIENRGGGNALIALSAVTNAAPDGYTLLLGSTSTIVMRVLEDSKKYAAAAALEPATIFSASSTSIVVNPRLPVNTMKEFIAYAKDRPGKLTFGSGGTGAITHVAGELFSQRAGLDMVHVPYKGIAPAMNDFLGNRLDALFPNVTSSILQMHANREVRVLAINAPERIDAAPNIPKRDCPISSRSSRSVSTRRRRPRCAYWSGSPGRRTQAGRRRNSRRR
jgi:tripartite-type tricarboxylate transporter receptor subunit TctC